MCYSFHVADLTILYLQFDKDGEGDKHQHPDGYEIVYLLKGKIEFSLEAKEGEYVGIVLKDVGDLVYFPAGCVHQDI